MLPEGLAFVSLGQELADMESLFFGMYQVVTGAIGCPATIEQREEAQLQQDIDYARKWLTSYQEDPDLAQDNRMMVPIFYDIERKMTKVWVMLGYSVSELTLSYN